jgi:hypothetical protein
VVAVAAPLPFHEGVHPADPGGLAGELAVRIPADPHPLLCQGQAAGAALTLPEFQLGLVVAELLPGPRHSLAAFAPGGRMQQGPAELPPRCQLRQQARPRPARPREARFTRTASGWRSRGAASRWVAIWIVIGVANTIATHHAIGIGGRYGSAGTGGGVGSCWLLAPWLLGRPRQPLAFSRPQPACRTRLGGGGWARRARTGNGGRSRSWGRG